MLRRTKAAINDNQSLESAHPSLLPLRRVFVRNLDMDPDELRIYYEFSHRHLVGYKIRNLQKEKKPGNGNYLTMMLRKRQSKQISCTSQRYSNTRSVQCATTLRLYSTMWLAKMTDVNSARNSKSLISAMGAIMLTIQQTILV